MPIAAAAATRDLAAESYVRLRELIVIGKLAPGAPLIETDVASRLGVSRTPVRAALQRLQQEGFVLASRVGQVMRAVVTPLTISDMRELYLIVGALEGAAARLAAGFNESAREAVSNSLAALNKTMRVATARSSPDIASAQDAHLRFHRLYVDAAAGPRLRAELESIRPQAERYERVYTTTLIREFDASLAEHDAIISGIRAGDGETAERMASLNWRNGAERYAGVLAILGERGAW